jgi:hypothetical protein
VLSLVGPSVLNASFATTDTERRSSSCFLAPSHCYAPVAYAVSLAAMASEAEEAESCAALVLEAMREPGFRSVCVDGTLDDEGCLLFLECPLAALKTVAKLLPMTADRAPEQRFKPLLARARAVSTSDVHLVRLPPAAQAQRWHHFTSRSLCHLCCEARL